MPDPALQGADTACAVPDYATAFRLYLPVAKAGDRAARCNLGRMYAEGRGAAQDSAEAANWWRNAADQGSFASLVNLGTMYADGKGVRPVRRRSSMAGCSGDRSRSFACPTWLNLCSAAGQLVPASIGPNHEGEM